MPSVSVILPSFDRCEFLRLAIASVFSQTYSDWELIIADDGSGEQTQSYLRSIQDPRLHVVWLRHCGNPSRVRNAAIAAATGEYLAFIDSDDIWAPSKLEQQLGALRTRAECRWSYTGCDRIDASGHPLLHRRPRALTPRNGWILEPLLKLVIAVAMPAVVAQRQLVQEVGGFDEQQLFGEFHDLCLRLAMRSEVSAVDQPLCSIRAHGQHYSADRIAATAAWMRLYRKMADLIPDARLRAYCARMRAQTSLQLARLQGDLGDYRAARATLRQACRFSCRYPHWWWGALKQLTRPVVPKRVMAAVRQRARSRTEGVSS
jgi:glycosyltransferase involved in cell wall biosynthesis